MNQSKPRIFVGMTGASGHRYTEVLLQALVRSGVEVDLSITEAGCKVLRHELGVEAGKAGELLEDALPAWLGAEVASSIRCFISSAVEAPASSGTSGTIGVILCPCSMGTLSRVSIGFSSNLVERAADVAIKEKRKLVLVLRETPLSEIHLENMLRLARLGAVVLPAMPGFYHAPSTIEDLVEHVVGKLLDTLGLSHEVGARWKGIARPDEESEVHRPR